MERRADDSEVDADVEAIVGVLDDAPVTVGLLYGSVARGDSHARSDIDVAVAFEAGLTSDERSRERLALIAGLSTALGRDDVDVVSIEGASQALRDSIRRDGQVIYGDPEQADAVLGSSDGVDRTGESPESLDQILDDIERVV